MKVFITKFALTSGIKELEVKTSDRTPSMVIGAGLFEAYHGEGKEWHRTIEGARERAKEMRFNRIVSLEKSITMLKKLEF